MVVQVPELIGILGLVLLAYGYGYWKGVDFGRSGQGPKPSVVKQAVNKVKKVMPHADPPVPTTTARRRPTYKPPDIGEEEL